MDNLIFLKEKLYIIMSLCQSDRLNFMHRHYFMLKWQKSFSTLPPLTLIIVWSWVSVLSLVNISLTHIHSCEVCTKVNKINFISVTTYCPLWCMKLFKPSGCKPIRRNAFRYSVLLLRIWHSSLWLQMSLARKTPVWTRTKIRICYLYKLLAEIPGVARDSR
jgi:hypothetical protein